MLPFPLPAGTSLNAAGGSAGPSRSDLLGGSQSFDGSNWTVTTGGSRADVQQPGSIPTNLIVAALVVIAAIAAWKISSK